MSLAAGLRQGIPLSVLPEVAYGSWEEFGIVNEVVQQVKWITDQRDRRVAVFSPVQPLWKTTVRFLLYCFLSIAVPSPSFQTQLYIYLVTYQAS